MKADLSRWTFDPTHGYRSVVMQQGRVLLDAEWNEQGSIAAHHDEVRTVDVVGPVGGPLPTDGGAGPFALVDVADGSTPVGVPWDRLGVTPGRYYVAGILAESTPDPENPAGAGAWPLADQPHLRTIGAGVAADPGLSEPTGGDGRWAAYLDVFDRMVSADEDPTLRESALGGPDTAVREQTVWQVRLEAIDAEVCSQVDAGPRVPREMAAGLREAARAADPCEISSGGGYTLLENQLYRVEIIEAGATPRYVWSRENGSVTAGLLGMTPSPEPGMDATLTVDRVGRDETLSIREGDLIEVTSADRQLRGLPGFLATAGPVVDLVMHVAWSGDAPTSVAALGETPVVRRWDGGPRALSTATQELEGGITVRFLADGEPAVGDYWLIPARTVRLGYGTPARQGTIDWPSDGGTPRPQPPAGTVHHRAPLGILERSSGAWTLDADCRTLFPPLTALTSIDLVGGDGQEAMPGDELDEPVRVVVRRGGVPVVGEPVRFTASGGGVTPGGGSPVVVATDTEGLAQVRWTLDPSGPTTQTLTAQRLDDVADGVDVPIVVTGRLSVAREVAWEAPCRDLADASTVQGGLDGLAGMPMARLLGGDGQRVRRPGAVVPELVRIVVDSPCGPVEATLEVRGSAGAVVQAVPDGTTPASGSFGPSAGQSISGTVDAAGVLALVWQPDLTPGSDQSESDTLRILLDDHAPIVVSAHLDVPGGRTGGLHVERIRVGGELDLQLGSLISPRQLTKGIDLTLDGEADPASVDDLPVGRLIVERPMGDDGFRQRFTIDGAMSVQGRRLRWAPSREAQALLGQWEEQLQTNPELGATAWFQVDGWLVVDLGNPEQHLNGHIDVKAGDGGPVMVLPTTDEVTGGRFEVWFSIGLRPRIPPIEDFTGRTLGFVRRRSEAAGWRIDVVEEDAPGVRGGTVLGTTPAAGEPLVPGEPVTVRVARGVS
ncbi:hypothetical protein AVL62_13545 [Serinicoccus chungangensis]|uniref:PASTA domain-containing protein n=1 Tax=Serinicoccus chungangensis TaxID=767452 RepID=A0A0W8IBW6_9MICO|nr:DUF6519 domain-containing protein [Serinicoccus chungangensis]KUG57443.1 hypothetical protein AVL62_13545 [Serinicoccus chungangensis]